MTYGGTLSLNQRPAKTITSTSKSTETIIKGYYGAEVTLGYLSSMHFLKVVFNIENLVGLSCSLIEAATLPIHYDHNY